MQCINHFVKCVNIIIVKPQVKLIAFGQFMIAGPILRRLRCGVPRLLFHIRFFQQGMTLRDQSRFVSPQRFELTRIGSHPRTIHGLDQSGHRRANHRGQCCGCRRWQGGWFLCECVALKFLSLDRHSDSFQRIIRIRGRRRFRRIRTMDRATTFNFPSFGITTIATTTRTGAVKVYLVTFMVRQAEAIVTNNTCCIGLTRPTVPGDIATFENITTRTAFVGRLHLSRRLSQLFLQTIGQRTSSGSVLRWRHGGFGFGIPNIFLRHHGRWSLLERCCGGIQKLQDHGVRPFLDKFVRDTGESTKGGFGQHAQRRHGKGRRRRRRRGGIGGRVGMVVECVFSEPVIRRGGFLD
mmetsp:Transcript_11499/g.25660  ORF Transcript_11499/g.25660 Transcript_11499/m.25660 type:complete len:351 (+) Transcript_11499:8076-9128(+)